MLIFERKQDLQQHLFSVSNANSTIGFVPTMGALHNGHLSLLELSCLNNEISVISIFVNPTQFNNPTDLEKYPRTLEKDIKKIAEVSDKIIIYAPSVNDIYEGNTTKNEYDFDGLENQMEGKFRPGHFNGVGTVVQKLFEIVKPTISYFGEKDFQQVQIVKKLVEKYKIPVEIVCCPILREPNGLAMSSRNERLTAVERADAKIIFETLEIVKEKFLTNDLTINQINDWVKLQFEKEQNFILEYFEIADEATLSTCIKRNIESKYRAFIAVFVRDIRLIDTITLHK